MKTHGGTCRRFYGPNIGTVMEITHAVAIKLVKKHGGITQAAKAAGVAYKYMWRRYNNKMSDGGGAPKKPVTTLAGIDARGARSLSEFKATYDKSYIVPRAIKAGLKSLGGGWEYEVAFAKMINVSLQDLGAYRDEFVQHVVALREGRRAWAGKASVADEMRKML